MAWWGWGLACGWAWPTSGRAAARPRPAEPGVVGPVSGGQCCRPPADSACGQGSLSQGLTYWPSPLYATFLSPPTEEHHQNQNLVQRLSIHQYSGRPLRKFQ